MKRLTLLTLFFVAACSSTIKSPYYLAYMAHPLEFSAPNEEAGPMWARGHEKLFDEGFEVEVDEFLLRGEWIDGELTIARLVKSDTTVFRIRELGSAYRDLKAVAHRIAHYMTTAKTEADYPAIKGTDN